MLRRLVELQRAQPKRGRRHARVLAFERHRSHSHECRRMLRVIAILAVSVHRHPLGNKNCTNDTAFNADRLRTSSKRRRQFSYKRASDGACRYALGPARMFGHLVGDTERDALNAQVTRIDRLRTPGSSQLIRRNMGFVANIAFSRSLQLSTIERAPFSFFVVKPGPLPFTASHYSLSSSPCPGPGNPSPHVVTQSNVLVTREHLGFGVA